MDSKYDLVLVGTSFASSFFLKKYLDKASKNVRILVLERGNHFSHSARLENAKNKAYGDNSFISSLGQQGKTYTSNSDKPWIFDPNFGGSSNCWTGCTPRFMPNDFKINSLYGKGADWPISYDDLEPYYVETEDLMSISGPEITPYPMSKAYPLPPHQLSSIDKLVQNHFGELYISQPTARASQALPDRNKCCSSSICHLCPVNAKFTIDNSLRYLYDDPRIEILYNAQVYALSTNGNFARNISFKHKEKDRKVEAEVIALGANAIFNAHILLNSGDTNPYCGKGISEQVGYYGYLYMDGVENLGGSSTITANGFMLYDGNHREDYAACIIENHNDTFIRGEFGKWRQIAKMKFIFEDLPDNRNQVKVSENILIPKIEYSGHTDYVSRGYSALKDNIEDLFKFLPLEKIELDENHQLSESHILSTTKMGNSAQDSVIDKNLIHHQYRNVFVLGGGAFPSITPSNPTLTLSALSLMAADKSF